MKALSWMLRVSGLVLLLGNTTCVETIAADSVAMNVARLTVLNADAAITALSDDTNCGFSSPQVRGNPVIDGPIPGEGTWSLVVSECEINFEVPTVTSTNCHTGVTTTAYGRVIFHSATLTVVGSILLADMFPVPAGPESVTIEADVSFENWMAGDSDQDSHMVWVSGGLSGVVRPMMAADGTSFCAVQTGNKAFWDVVYEPSEVQIVSGDVTINIDVDSSNLHGAQGIHRLPDQEELIENELSGEMSIWGQRFTLPLPDDPGLDPEYDAAEFVLSDECREGIVVPIDYACGY